MGDWQVFVDSVPWFLDAGAAVSVSESHPGESLPPPLASQFPSLARLLARATVTRALVNGTEYHLLGWDDTEGLRFGWLCAPPVSQSDQELFEEHRKLLRCFGGIVERFNEPECTWLLNQNEVLTEREASHDASFLQDSLWAFEDAGVGLPIRPTEYYSIAREANGNTTLCHRTRGNVLLFAPDHAFDHVEPLEGCPEYTLYTINGAAVFREWVEALAAQWLAYV